MAFGIISLPDGQGLPMLPGFYTRTGEQNQGVDKAAQTRAQAAYQASQRREETATSQRINA